MINDRMIWFSISHVSDPHSPTRPCDVAPFVCFVCAVTSSINLTSFDDFVSVLMVSLL